jgi:hypothetical protein
LPNVVKNQFLDTLKAKFGETRALAGSHSLFEVGDTSVRIYVRYSKVHTHGRTFYGLRIEDIKQLEGKPSVIAFLWDKQQEPLFVQFAEYEELFNTLTPASDGQFKAQVFIGQEATELYIASAGRFNVESGFGWDVLQGLIAKTGKDTTPVMTHSQVQSLLGSIGSRKGFDIWVPSNDRVKLDWAYGEKFPVRDKILGFESVQNVLEEIDVIWIQKGSSDVRALFEVEHTTPIYTGLLRFNDIHLVAPQLNPRFTIVAHSDRRALFARQLNRPTFRMSGISKLCTFLEYSEIFGWFKRLTAK